MESPATIDTASGRNTGSVITSAASAANTPLLVTWLRNVGPPPRSGPPDSLSASTIAVGTSASTTSSTWTRRRRKRWLSSASNIEALPGERDEGVFERRTLDGEAAQSDPAGHQRTRQVL